MKTIQRLNFFDLIIPLILVGLVFSGFTLLLRPQSGRNPQTEINREKIDQFKVDQFKHLPHYYISEKL